MGPSMHHTMRGWLGRTQGGAFPQTSQRYTPLVLGNNAPASTATRSETLRYKPAIGLQPESNDKHDIRCLGRTALHTRWRSAVLSQASAHRARHSSQEACQGRICTNCTSPMLLRAECPLQHLVTSLTMLQGWSNAWVTSKQADSARLHEVPAWRKLPLMLRSAAVQQRALQHSQMLGSSLHGHPYPK